jgi:hypothetical protein
LSAVATGVVIVSAFSSFTTACFQRFASDPNTALFIYNLRGTIVATTSLQRNRPFDALALPPGIYLLKSPNLPPSKLFLH